MLHIAGQSREQFEAYLSEVCDWGRACPVPVGGSAYASLHQSLLEPMTMAAGNTQDVMALCSYDFVGVLHLGLWLHTTELAPIAAGRFDAEIDRLHRELVSTGRRLLVRVGYEFDGPHNRFEPTEYQRAFRHIAQRLRDSPAIEFVWHSYAWEPTSGGQPIASWYPGDEWVDWIGMTVFSFTGGDRARQSLLDMANDRRKPVLVAECSPIRVGPLIDAHGDALWAGWFEPFHQFIDSNQVIGGVSVIECDWDSIEQFKPLKWGDARIAADPIVLTRWRSSLVERHQTWHHGAT